VGAPFGGRSIWSWRSASSARGITKLVEEGPRCCKSARQGGFDRAHVPPAIEGFAGKQHHPVIDFRKHRLCRAGPRRGVGIGSAGETVVGPIDRLCGDQSA